jgi:hypothetical protein
VGSILHGELPWRLVPKTEAIYDEVMRDDAVFEFYRRTLIEDRKAFGDLKL